MGLPLPTLAAACLGGLLAVASARAEPPPNPRCKESAAASDDAQVVIDLNAASEQELEQLPGIGPSRARAIVAFRQSHGGFSQVSQLMRIKGIGRAMLRKLRPFVTVSVPPATAARPPAQASPEQPDRVP